LVDYNTPSDTNFTINDVGDCNSINQYGFKIGKPCLLIKINKVCVFFDNLNYQHLISQIVGFIPEIGRTDIDQKYESACTNIPNIPVRCMGEVCF
jgi:hypothetical protein